MESWISGSYRNFEFGDEKMKLLRIATRKSQLALCQAELVKQALLSHFPDLIINLVPLSTSGDQLLAEPLAAIGGKGLFIKEIEEALLDNRADIAVHSMKDMPVQITPNLDIPAYLEREDPRDVLVSLKYKYLSDMPSNSKIGTASLRRQSMVKHFHPNLITETLRGNVVTRLSKLDAGQYDALILAAAGLKRLGLTDRIQSYFSITDSLPAVGQGIIGVQCRENDDEIKKILLLLNHIPTQLCLTAERILNKTLGGSCHAPIGGYAFIDPDQKEKLHLGGCVYSVDGKICLKSEASGNIKNISKIGQKVAEDLLNQGADEILKNINI